MKSDTYIRIHSDRANSPGARGRCEIPLFRSVYKSKCTWMRHGPSLQQSHQKASLFVGAIGALCKPSPCTCKTHKSHTYNASTTCVGFGGDALWQRWWFVESVGSPSTERAMIKVVQSGWFRVKCGMNFKTIRELVHRFDSILYILDYMFWEFGWPRCQIR